MKKFEEKTIESKHIFTGNVIEVKVDQVELPDGNTSERELVKHPGAVAVIPITKEGKIIFVEQYRKPLERSLIEIPAGKLDSGERPMVAAIRELEEETGYTTKELGFVTSFYTSPGYSNEIVHIYVTDQLEKLEVAVPGDDDEFLEVIELTLDEAKQLVEEEKIYDAKTIYAILYLHALQGAN